MEDFKKKLSLKAAATGMHKMTLYQAECDLPNQEYEVIVRIGLCKWN